MAESIGGMEGQEEASGERVEVLKYHAGMERDATNARCRAGDAGGQAGALPPQVIDADHAPPSPRASPRLLIICLAFAQRLRCRRSLLVLVAWRHQVPPRVIQIKLCVCARALIHVRLA
jgi:hypothetical protein